MKYRSVILLVLAPMLIMACTGKLEQLEQQVTISITPNQEMIMEPGQSLGLSANAKAIDEPLTAMRWSIEAITTALPPIPTIANMACTDVTLTIKDDDGIGSCRAELNIPADAEPMTWRIGASADSTSKGSASASFVVKVIAPVRDNGNFRIEVPALVTTDANGGTLYVNDLVSIEATATSEMSIDDLVYRWTQTSSQSVALAGVNTNKLQFVPRVAGEYQFTVTASGKINGRDESVDAEVLVIVGNIDPESTGLNVYAGPAIAVASGASVVLTGEANLNGSALTNPGYRWTQIAGTRVTLANSTSATPSFFAPTVESDTELVFRLDVTATEGGIRYEGSSQTVVRVAPPPAEEE